MYFGIHPSHANVSNVTRRCLDLPPEIRSKKRMAAPLVIIPGPKEPSNLEPYISGVLQEFSAYGPTMGTPDSGGAELKVTVIKRHDPTGELTTTSMVHQPILGSTAADTPAAAKMDKRTCTAARMGCGGCLLQGTNDIPVATASGAGPRTRKGVMHYLGYDKPTQCGLCVEGLPSTAHLCGAEEIRLDHDSQVTLHIVHI